MCTFHEKSILKTDSNVWNKNVKSLDFSERKNTFGSCTPVFYKRVWNKSAKALGKLVLILRTSAHDLMVLSTTSIFIWYYYHNVIVLLYDTDPGGGGLGAPLAPKVEAQITPFYI